MSQPDLRSGKGERVERQDARDAPTGADHWNGRLGIEQSVEDGSENRRDRDQRQVTRAPEEVLHIVAERDEEVEVRGEMPKAAVDEEGGQGSEASQTKRLRGNEAETRHKRLKIREGQQTHQRNGRRHTPRDHGRPRLHRGVVFHR